MYQILFFLFREEFVIWKMAIFVHANEKKRGLQIRRFAKAFGEQLLYDFPAFGKRVQWENLEIAKYSMVCDF